jgi:hypothetical protein
MSGGCLTASSISSTLTRASRSADDAVADLLGTDRTCSGRDVLCQISDLGLAFFDVAAI